MIEVGTKVGCSYRWPYDHAHPGCWQRPHEGELLAINDPRAWAGSMKFGYSMELPPQTDVDKHVEWCLSQGLLSDSVPVLWNYGKVQWERADALHPYDEELLLWETARAKAYAERDPLMQMLNS